MVKITSIFGSYRFSKNSIAWHFLTFRSLSSQLEFVYPPWSWGVEEQMLIFLSWWVKDSWNPVPKLAIVLIWKTPACLKFGKTSNCAVGLHGHQVHGQRTVGQKHIEDAAQIFLYNDVSPYFKAVGPNRFHFSHCHQKASSKAVFNWFSKQPQFHPDKESGLSVQVNRLTTLTQHDDIVATAFPKGRQ